VDHLGGQFLPGQAGVLPVGGLHSCLGELISPADLAVAEPGLQPFAADSAEGGRSLVARCVLNMDRSW
jgi:hypothetical protein